MHRFKYAIVFSINDPAGKGVAEKLIELMNFDKCSECISAEECYCIDNIVLAGFREDVIYFDFLDYRLPKVDKVIVLSRHSSTAKVKSYTVHHTGNPGDQALYGGKPRSLAIAAPTVSHRLLLLLKKYAEEFKRINEYEVSYEATHHGPTEVNKPISFIEIGSSIDEWRDPVNHNVLAHTITEFFEVGESVCTPAIGIGGGHYPRKHTKQAFQNNICYGHIFAKYAIPYLDKYILEKAYTRSDPRPTVIVVEKKSTRREHRMFIEEYCSSKKLKLAYI